MNNDLKIIKKQYGETMMHLCREMFSTILDNSPGILSKILLDNFESNRFLYDDLIQNGYIADFKNYIYKIYDRLHKQQEKLPENVANPCELLRQAGYTLYECTSEEDIQKFKKYYVKDEELCTFWGHRLDNCYVFFAIHDCADKLHRKDFDNPHRQDKYGTSVISIQFTRDDSHTLSIKNRYNHTVVNPDATFSNNLDNIIPGLTESFAKYYGMTQSNVGKNTFEMPGYVQASDHKFYKYNYELGNVYYCPNNIVIDNFQVIKYPKESYLVADYFIIDLVNKTITSKIYDCFPDTIGSIKNIKIINKDNQKIVVITPNNGENVEIILDKYNRIIGYKNNNVQLIDDDFLSHNRTIKDISLNQVTDIGNYFLCDNVHLKKISLPNVLTIGDYFIQSNTIINQVFMPNVISIGSCFLESNVGLQEIALPKVKRISDNFLCDNSVIRHVFLPEVTDIGRAFLIFNENLKSISLPKVKRIEHRFCERNTKIQEIELPNVLEIGSRFLFENTTLTKVNLPKVISIGDEFLYFNRTLNYFDAPNLEFLGEYALILNLNVYGFYAPKLVSKIDNEQISKTWYLSALKARKLKR